MRDSGWKRLAILAGVAALIGIARPVQAQVLVQGIGGITKTASQNPVWAGAIGGKAGPVEISAEGGKFMNIIPKTIFDSTKAATGGAVEAELPAWYGMGNLKLIAKSGVVQPFVQAGAGAARLHPQFTTNDPRVTLITQFGDEGDTTKFMAGAGGGLRIVANKAILEGGYRFVRVFHNFESNTDLDDDEVLVNVHMFYVSLGFHS
jgi:hypothetical protein